MLKKIFSFSKIMMICWCMIFCQPSYAMTIDEISEFFAGEIGNKEHFDKISASWNKYAHGNLAKLKMWRKQYLTEFDDKNCTVFYPFSGPDVVHPLSLMPSCHNYIMVGLENPGKVSTLSPDRFSLENIRNGIDSLLSRSFFITRDMGSDFARGNNGLIVPMLTLLKLMDNKIIEVKNFKITENGDMIFGETGNGIRITFKQIDKEINQNIYYISGSLMEKTPIINYLQKQEGHVITYLKAAQYALFDYRFRPMVEEIIKKSDMIVQDDSGLPFYLFKDKAKWQVSIYGEYAGPYGESFRAYKQNDLLQFSKANSVPVGFKHGYGYAKAPTCLMKIIKLH